MSLFAKCKWIEMCVWSRYYCAREFGEMRFARRRRTSRYPRVWNLILMWNAPSGNSPNVILPGISGGQYPPSLCLVVPPVMICILCSDCDSLNFSRTLCLFNWWSVALSLLLFWNFDLFEVLDCLPSLRLVPFEFSFSVCCVQTQDNGRNTSSTPKSLYSSVWSLPAKCVCRASVQGRGSHSHRNAFETFKCHSTNVALSLCQFA